MIGKFSQGSVTTQPNLTPNGQGNDANGLSANNVTYGGRHIYNNGPDGILVNKKINNGRY